MVELERNDGDGKEDDDDDDDFDAVINRLVDSVEGENNDLSVQQHNN